jgi:cell division inhibitor SepF
MGVRDQLERVAAWFGFGVDDDDEDYYDEEEERRPYAKDRYAGGRYGGDRYAAGDDLDAESGPTVRRLGRAERSSAFGTSLGNLFGSEGPGRDRSYGGAGEAGGSSHLRAVPDQRVPPTRVSVVHPTSFNDAQALADRFKRQQPVIVNLQQTDEGLGRRMVDFCSGLTYALDGQIQEVANRVFLLTPRNVEVSAEERKRLAERAFYNQL